MAITPPFAHVLTVFCPYFAHLLRSFLWYIVCEDAKRRLVRAVKGDGLCTIDQGEQEVMINVSNIKSF